MRRGKKDNFNNGNGAIRRYDLGHAWECTFCHAVVTARCDAEDHCKEKKNDS